MEDKYGRDFSKYPESKIVEEWFEDGVKVVILSCKGSHFTAYLGLPETHPLAGFSYDDIPFSVHGGLTYASSDSKVLPKGFYFYGWDYAHAGDRTYFDNPARTFIEGLGDNGHDWTLEEVKSEVEDALEDFKQLVKLAENIKK